MQTQCQQVQNQMIQAQMFQSLVGGSAALLYVNMVDEPNPLIALAIFFGAGFLASFTIDALKFDFKDLKPCL